MLRKTIEIKIGIRHILIALFIIVLLFAGGFLVESLNMGTYLFREAKCLIIACLIVRFGSHCRQSALLFFLLPLP